MYFELNFKEEALELKAIMIHKPNNLIVNTIIKMQTCYRY